MINFYKLKAAPLFLLAGTFLYAQQKDSIKTKNIDQVVLVGYGTKKKKDLTGSVTSISAKDFNGGMVSSPEQLIQGKAAGVQITSNGGAPGSGSSIRIRGAASLNASNDPLIVIDGMPLDNNGINGAANPLSLINPDDIESFNILKDASAAAIYGNRATNGVIIITTKHGKKGKLRVGYSSTTSVSEKFGKIKVLGGDQYRALVNEISPNEYKALLTNYNTDWQDAIYQLAPGFDNNITFSGGLGSLPYRLSIGYLNQDGIIKTNNIKRTTAGISLSPKFFKNSLSVNLNLKGTYAENRFADSETIGYAIAFDPTKPIYDKAMPQLGGYWEWLDPAKNEPITLAPKNPVSNLFQRWDISYVRRVLGNVQFDYKLPFLPDLRANLNIGLDYADSNGHVIAAPTLASAFYTKGTNRDYSQNKKNRLLEFYLNYTKKLPSLKSDFDLMAGYSYQKWNENTPFSPTIYGDGTQVPATGVDFFTQNILLSYYGRLNYTFDKKYLLTASIRRDGSSRFSEENRWGYFPSVSLAWRMDQEDFLKDNKSISTLKLRGGWGITGQQDIGSNYPYLAIYGYSDGGANYQIGDHFYTLIRPSGYDKNIKWETTETKNIGLDFGLFKDRVLFTVDAYKRKTKDLLSIVPVPAGVNFTNLLMSNVGDMESKGLEFSLTSKVIDNNDFTWDISANATFQKAEITNLSVTNNPDQKVLTGGIKGGTGNTVQVQTVGYAPNSFYVYQQKYDSNGKPIEGEYVDRNGDGKINEQDLYQDHSPMPKAIFGLSSSFRYKNWDLGFALRANIGNYVYNNMNSEYGYSHALESSSHLRNLTADYYNTRFKDAQYLSDYYVEDASFLRMDNISIGYNFPTFIGNGKLRINATVNNVFVVTKYRGLDPEVFNGIDNNFYQRPRVYSLGFNIKF